MEEFQLLERQLSHEAGRSSTKAAAATKVPSSESVAAAENLPATGAAPAAETGQLHQQVRCRDHQNTVHSNIRDCAASEAGQVSEITSGHLQPQLAGYPSFGMVASDKPIHPPALDLPDRSQAILHQQQQQQQIRHQSEHLPTQDASTRGSNQEPGASAQRQKPRPEPMDRAQGHAITSHAITNRSSAGPAPVAIAHGYEVPDWRQQHPAQSADRLQGKMSSCHLADAAGDASHADQPLVPDWRQHVDWAGPKVQPYPTQDALDSAFASTSQEPPAQCNDGPRGFHDGELTQSSNGQMAPHSQVYRLIPACACIPAASCWLY